VKLTKIGALGAVVTAGALVLAGCSTSTPTNNSTPTATTKSAYDLIDTTLSGTITAGGSSAQANAETGFAAAYNSVNKNVTVNYNKDLGSGGGRTNFLNKSLDFAGSDAPLSAAETTTSMTSYPSAGAVNLPIYLDGVAVVANISGVTKLNLKTATIAKIFAGKITNWSDAAITADNGGTALPSKAITLVVRADSSGTAQNFTNFLYASDPTDWPWAGSGSWPTSKSTPAYSATTDAKSGGGAVATEVAAVDGSIAYLDHSAIASGMIAATVNGVDATSEAVAQAYTTGASIKGSGVAGDLSISFNYPAINNDAKAYPIPLLSYAIVPLTFANATQGKLVVDYLKFVATAEGQKAGAAKAKSVALPDSILKQVQATLATIK